MDYYFTACKIVNLLLQGDVPDNPLLDAIRLACHDRRWSDARGMVVLRCEEVRDGAAEDLVWDCRSWKSVRDIIRGATALASHDRVGALQSFIKANARMSGDESHIGMISLIAQGLTYKIDGETADKQRAVVALSHAECDARQFAGRSDTERERQQQCYYASLASHLKALIAELQEPTLPRLLPVVQGTAGPVRYVPGDDFSNASGLVAVDTQAYSLLNYQDRKTLDPDRTGALADRIRSDPEYFLFDVEGDSMWGSRCRIRHGDKLLVKAGRNWRDDFVDPAVIQEAESKPRVKFVKVGKNIITLRSANPRYGPEVYTKDSPRLDMLGIVKAILKEKQ